MTGEAAGWWRHAAIAGLAAGLAASTLLSAPTGWLSCIAVAATALALAVRSGALSGGLTTLPLAAGLAAIAGLGIGSARLGAIDDGALQGSPGQRASLAGFVTAVPERDSGQVRVQIDAPEGRLVAVAREPVPDLPTGAEVRVRGTLAEPDEFRGAQMKRAGAALELRTSRLELTGASRDGFAGVLDAIRARAEDALGVGASKAQAALARGFVLGQDDRIDPRTTEEFRRAGLSHLLAVSGQNVMLLAILSGFALAPFGVRLRSRLLITLVLIALYVPVAGAGPSIQRAGIMGGAAIVATLAGRASNRAYPPLLAAAATLLVNPRFAADAGWQLSFAAVVGIMLWGSPLRSLIAERLEPRLPGGPGRMLAEGLAITLAATAATAPLIAHDFERLSLASVPANVLALPAIAPVMWIGMLIALVGQLPGLPPAILGAVEGGLVDYVCWVAARLGSPAWAEAEVAIPSPAAVAVTYLGVSIAVAVAISALRRRRGLGVPAPVVALAATAALAAGYLLSEPGGAEGPPARTLEIVELDVGQGDATLLRPAAGDPVLVDTGPPGGEVVAELSRLGVERLQALFITHADLDHTGGLTEVLSAVEVREFLIGRRSGAIEGAARAAGARIVPVAEGSTVDLGRLRIDVLWPPRTAVANPVAEANDDSLVLAARFGAYDALITGDAEQESTHLEPGPFDVLKVAHHGSDDAGLPALLDRSVPRVALIGVGAGNGYGHPTDSTLTTLADHGVCTLRTDLDGTSTVSIGPAGLAVEVKGEDPVSDRPGCSSAAP